jgi:hypothetical protein
MTEAWDERERRRAEAAEEHRRKAATCARQGHEWVLLDAHPDWYDGCTYQCDRCHAVEFRCVDGAEGTLYEDPEHDPRFRAAGHEWLLGPQPAAPCAGRHAECVHCHLHHTRWPDVDHEWVYENPDPSLSDPEWAMAVGLQEWTGTRRCIRCGVSAYKNPRW